MSDDLSYIGRLLRSERAKRGKNGRGMSLRALADRSGLHFTHIFDIEHGRNSRTGETTVRTLEKLAHGLGIEVEPLIKAANKDRLERAR